MTDTRRRNETWAVAQSDGTIPTWERVGIAVLMDIRDELQTLNRLLSCQSFIGIPATLRGIKRNTAKPQRRQK